MNYALLMLISIVAVAALDLTAIKLRFCDKLKQHWAYDRLMLKHTCLQLVKQIGSELCVDVINNIFVLCVNLVDVLIIGLLKTEIVYVKG